MTMGTQPLPPRPRPREVVLEADLGPGCKQPGPKVVRFGYCSWMNCVITVRVSPLASISVQIA